VNAPRAASEHALGLRTLYILPTRHGLLYGLVALVALVAGANYANGMAYGLAFLMAAIALVAMLHTHRNLSGLRVAAGAAPPVYAGQNAVFAIRLFNEGGPERIAIRLEADGAHTELALAAGETGVGSLAFRAPRRGYLALPAVTVHTRFPLGLWRVWSRRLALGGRCLVYPRPAAPGVVPLDGRRPPGTESGTTLEGDDFAGLREYRLGDAAQHIAWKAAARGQGLYTKQFAGGAPRERWLEWDAFPGLEPEERLSVLCRLVLEADESGQAYGLRLPTVAVEPSHGPAHRDRCLECLALFPTRP